MGINKVFPYGKVDVHTLIVVTDKAGFIVGPDQTIPKRRSNNAVSRKRYHYEQAVKRMVKRIRDTAGDFRRAPKIEPCELGLRLHKLHRRLVRLKKAQELAYHYAVLANQTQSAASRATRNPGFTRYPRFANYNDRGPDYWDRVADYQRLVYQVPKDAVIRSPYHQ